MIQQEIKNEKVRKYREFINEYKNTYQDTLRKLEKELQDFIQNRKQTNGTNYSQNIKNILK
jgi:thiaminase